MQSANSTFRLEIFQKNHRHSKLDLESLNALKMLKRVQHDIMKQLNIKNKIQEAI